MVYIPSFTLGYCARRKMSKEESFVLQFAPKNEQENYLNITTATTTITTTDSEPVISQKSMHLFSQPHRTSVSVIQFTNEGKH